MENFSERLKSARKMAGLSLEALAQKMNKSVTRQALNKYEQGKMLPNSDVLLLLGKALNIKTEYFFRPARTRVEFSQPAFRKQAKLGKAKQESIQEKVREYVERFFDAELLYPPERFHQYQLKPLISEIGNLDQVERLAERLREEWDLGTAPLGNLVQLLEDRNVIVVQVRAESYFDGLSCWANETKPVVVIRDGVPGDRQRSSLAHELGHLIINPALQSGLDEEKAAFRFSAAFLVPRKMAFYELGQQRSSLNLVELHQLKMKYGMSMQQWVYWAKDLGIISEAYYKQWYQQFSAQGWRLQEPGDQIPPEKPMRLRQIVLQALEELVISESRAAELLKTTINDVRQLRGRQLEGISH